MQLIQNVVVKYAEFAGNIEAVAPDDCCLIIFVLRIGNSAKRASASNATFRWCTDAVVAAVLRIDINTLDFSCTRVNTLPKNPPVAKLAMAQAELTRMSGGIFFMSSSSNTNSASRNLNIILDEYLMMSHIMRITVLNVTSLVIDPSFQDTNNLITSRGDMLLGPTQLCVHVFPMLGLNI
jgi:hypothetical protein